MPYLIVVTILWAFSFSLIGQYLAGQVDSDFAVLARVVIAAAIFVPLTAWRGVPAALWRGFWLAGALQFGVPLSVDTVKPEVMQRVLELGADIVNDINALRLPGALGAVAAHPCCGVCLMHMHGDPATMQSRPAYDDVVAEVSDFLQERAAALLRRGVALDRIVFDPGIGFGKSVAHNLELLRRQRELLALGRPLLLGWSRKSTLGTITGRPVGERLAASVAAALASVHLGARVVRVHDVAATVDALKVWDGAGLGG